MPVITLLNQKGGVGKTSLTHHLAGSYGLSGRRVLLIDNDPQASLSQGLLGPATTRKLDPANTLTAIYRGEDPFPEQVIRPSGIANVDLLPGGRAVNAFNRPEPQTEPYELQTVLRTFLEPLATRYDLILIDCPPNLCLCSWTALTASDYLVVPLQAEDYGAQGIVDVQESVAMVQASTNPELRLLGYVLMMFNARKTIHRAYETRLRELYGAEVFQTAIPHAADFPEAIAYRKPVQEHKPKGAAARAVRALAEELDGRIVQQITSMEAA